LEKWGALLKIQRMVAASGGSLLSETSTGKYRGEDIDITRQCPDLKFPERGSATRGNFAIQNSGKIHDAL
jgi:hypothetical protein